MRGNAAAVGERQQGTRRRCENGDVDDVDAPVTATLPLLLLLPIGNICCRSLEQQLMFEQLSST